MISKDPFSGMRLSEQAGTGKLDQRLFAPEPAPVPSSRKPDALPRSEPEKPLVAPSASPPTPAAPTKPKALGMASRFDLSEEPLYKASFLFTQEELEALEDLKLELRREYDTKVTKNALIRAALHILLEDHAANGKRSYASRKILKK
ncbi:MAG: hypothetical protein M1358_08980 [Chloroflexi bacterium]|nr:hypothetical protein [Chloroflexota bacterium]